MSRVCTGIKGEIFEMKEMVSLKIQRGGKCRVFLQNYIVSLILMKGLPWWLSGKESIC